jgi:CRISPR-associated protein Cas2
MLVAIACDPGNEDHRQKIHTLLLQYGFSKLLAGLYESATISENQLIRLKRELDRQTDSYDSLRIYQYPMNNTLVITSLKEKKWRKLTVRA